MNLNPFQISLLLIAILTLPLAVIFFIFGSAKYSRLYAIFLLTDVAWGLGGYFAVSAGNAADSAFLWKIAYSAVILIPVLFLHMVMCLTQDQRKWILVLSYGQGILFLIFLYNGQLFPRVTYIFQSLYYIQGDILYLFNVLTWTTITIFANIELFKFYRQGRNVTKDETRILTVASLGFFGSINNFLPGFGIEIYPYGNFLIPISIIFATYILFVSQGLDVKIVIRKGFAYSASISVLTVIYAGVVLMIERGMEHSFSYKSTIASILVAFVIGLVFIPLRNRLQLYIDKQFFAASPPQIAEENVKLRQQVADSDRMKAVATLASGLAHEIRNPLTAIQTFSEYLPRKLDDKEFLLKFSKIVGKEVTRINDLITQLLDFAKPFPPKMTRVDINALLRDILDFLNSRLVPYKIQLIQKLHASPSTIEADPNQLKQAILNVLINAIEAMPDGGVLTVATTAVTSDERPAASDHIVVEIADTGRGISPIDLPHIFDPFYSKKDNGTGLGLAITQGIVQKHKGKISAKGNPGGGAILEIVFPLAEVAGR